EGPARTSGRAAAWLGVEQAVQCSGQRVGCSLWRARGCWRNRRCGSSSGCAHGVVVDRAAASGLAVSGGPCDRPPTAPVVGDHACRLLGLLLLVAIGAEAVGVAQGGRATPGAGPDVVGVADGGLAVGAAAGLVGPSDESGQGR